MTPTLVLSQNGEVLGEFELVKERTTIGRKPDNDILLQNTAVSAQHAVITTVGDDVLLEDRDSKNGTAVNGIPVSKQILRDGDIVTITRYELRYLATSRSNSDATRVISPGQGIKGDLHERSAPLASQAPATHSEATTDFLERLRREADEREAKKQENARLKQQKAGFVRAKVQPRIRTLYKYFSNLAVQLNRLSPEVTASYDVEGYGSLSTVQQGGYRVSTENPEQPDKFTLSFVREGKGIREFQKNTASQIQRQRDYLWSHNLRFGSKVDNKGVGTFYLQPRIPVVFEFFTDFQRARIGLRVRNAVSLGSSTYSYAPDSIDTHLLDEMAKYVLNRPNRFNELSGNVVSEKTRTRLRLQLRSLKTGQ